MKTVKYQKDQLDQSTHTYYYDKLNRLEEVFVSTDKVHQSRQAHYLYYDYGPLACVETGEQKVQGMDYAYTINGWMKAMNGTILDPGYELGRDNASGYLSQNTSVHNKVARDVVGYTLGYFDEDYQSIGSTNFTPSPFGFTAFDAAVSPMYNGNIAFTTTAIADVPGAVTPMEIQMGLYRYDQMNRLVAARTFRASGLAASNSWSGIAETQEYKSTYSYDQNGNLTHLLRNGGASNINMDDFSYNFEPVANTLPLTGTHASNRLDYVHDIGSYTGNYSQDIDDQSADNYGYDRLGQLIRDDSEGMTIEWFSGSRKVKNITSTTSVIDFEYNPFGQRILKKVKDLTTGAITNSYYAYDANGQVMGVYTLDFETTGATLNELNLYGASRIGIIDKDVDLCIDGTAQAVPVYPSPSPLTHILGYKKYEIINYLGNVNAVISDRKIYTGGTYTAVMLMNSDYYPFGMQMPGRNTNISDYRFGYNGMEMDNEAKGNGNSYTTEFRQYDPRLGRWLSLDPLMGKFPSISPYVAFNDNPIFFVDPYGLSPGNGDPIKVPMKGEQQDPKSEADIVHNLSGVDNNQQVFFEYDGKSDNSKTVVTYTYIKNDEGGGTWNWSLRKTGEGHAPTTKFGSIEGSLKNSTYGGANESISNSVGNASTVVNDSKLIIAKQFGISEGAKYKTQSGLKSTDYAKSKGSNYVERLYNQDGSLKNKTLPKSFYKNLKAIDGVLGPVSDATDIYDIIQDFADGRTDEGIEKAGIFILDKTADKLLTTPHPIAIASGALIKLGIWAYENRRKGPLFIPSAPKPNGGIYQDNLEKEDVVPYLSRMPIMRTR